jgi:hypothetical protein
MEENKNVSKIIVKSSHELTDIVKEIKESKGERIVLTFTDKTDLLISPINLKVLQESADKEEKLLIAQIIQNATGVRNSKLAGLKVIETPSNPTEDDWEDALEIIERRITERAEKKKIKEVKKEEESPKSSFEDRVNSAISKSKGKEYVDRRGIQKEDDFISIDSDIPKEENSSENLAKEDNSVEDIPIKGVSEKPQPREVQTAVPLIAKFKRKFSSLNLKDKRFLKLGLKVLVPLLILVAISFAIYDQMATFAKVRIFVEAKPVEIEKIFTGDSSIEEIDFDNLKIPIKEGEVTKKLSDSINASGKAFKGEKAKGNLRITYYMKDECNEDTPKIILNSGHTLTSKGYAYKLVGSAQLVCNSMTDVEVIAADIGEEYNIATGSNFVVQGHPDSQIYGLNSAAFTGGTKQEYTVLSQQDVDTAIERLSQNAIEEVKSDLRKKETTWDIIENTIKSEVDKSSIKTDVAVGAEAGVVNIDVTIKGTATYYSTRKLNEGLTELLRIEATENNLFESNKDIELALGDTIDKELTVEESDDDSIIIKLEAKATIKPKVSKTDIENSLRGMRWGQGLDYLSNLKFADQNTEVEFLPQSYPSFLKRFPSRQGGVMVTIVELEITE